MSGKKKKRGGCKRKASNSSHSDEVFLLRSLVYRVSCSVKTGQGMDRRFSQCIAIVVMALYFLGLACFAIVFTHKSIVWCIVWAVCFSLLNISLSLFIRGMLFLATSVALGLLGVVYARAVETPRLWAIEYFSQVMVLVGSGVGAAFIAAHYLSFEGNTANESSVR